MTVAPSMVISAHEIDGATYNRFVNLNAQAVQSCPFQSVQKITDSSAPTSVFVPDRDWATHRASEAYGFQVSKPTGMATKASTTIE